MGAEDGKSLSRQAATFLKPRGSAISGLGLGDPGDDVKSDFSCMSCLHSLAHQCQTLLLPALQLQCCHLSSLRVRGAQPAGVTSWAGCSTSVQPGKLLHGTSPFSLSSHHTGGISGSSAGLLTVAAGAAGSSVGSSVGATSSVDTSAGVSCSVGSPISCGVGGLLTLAPGYPLAPQ